MRPRGLSTFGATIFEALVFPSYDDEGQQVFTIYVNNQPYPKTVNLSFQSGYEYVIPFELTGGTTPEVYYLEGEAQINSRTTDTLPAQHTTDGVRLIFTPPSPENFAKPFGVSRREKQKPRLNTMSGRKIAGD